MADPKVLDFSADAEDAITIRFPDGETTCELPTIEEPSLEAMQFISANGEEWFKLYSKSDLTEKQRQRFNHLNDKLIHALLGDRASDKAIATLTSRHRARIIVGFMTASPNLLSIAQQMVEAENNEKGKTKAS